jgi:hypothetical protein
LAEALTVAVLPTAEEPLPEVLPPATGLELVVTVNMLTAAAACVTVQAEDKPPPC